MTEPDFAPFTRYLQLADGAVTFRGETLDDLRADMKEFAEMNRELADLTNDIKAMYERKAAPAKEERPSRASSARPARGSSTRSSGRSSDRSTRPGSRPARGAKRDEPPLIDETCDCGEPYKDLDGMTYTKGPKAGQLYPNRYYASCDNRDCKPWGDQS